MSVHLSNASSMLFSLFHPLGQIHHLVGHAQKVTCVRFSEDGQTVFSGSADRSIKVWDIRARTYRQNVTLRHSSTCNCIDIGSNGVDLVSGHHDGGLRFWDVRSGERTMDLPGRLRVLLLTRYFYFFVRVTSIVTQCCSAVFFYILL